MFQEDFIMRQIEAFARTLALLLFGKQTTVYELPAGQEETGADELHRRLLALLEQGQVNQAEDLLFESLDSGERRYLEVAIDFYTRLNEWGDDALEQAGFSREEVEQGLRACARLFGVQLDENKDA